MLPPLFLGANLDSLRCRVELPFCGPLDRWTVGPLGVEPHHTVLDLCAVPHKPSLWESWLMCWWGLCFFSTCNEDFCCNSEDLGFFLKRCICMNTFPLAIPFVMPPGPVSTMFLHLCGLWWWSRCWWGFCCNSADLVFFLIFAFAWTELISIGNAICDDSVLYRNASRTRFCRFKWPQAPGSKTFQMLEANRHVFSTNTWKLETLEVWQTF